jgi:HrpA-like RNA helicase
MKSGRKKTIAGADPLDARGAHPNFLTGRKFTEARREWAAKWSTFPVYSDAKALGAIVRSLDKNRVTVVISATGSGKSVLTPALALHRDVEQRGLATRWTVGVTVPKKILALAAADTAASTLDVDPADGLVGYQYRGAPRGSQGASPILDRRHAACARQTGPHVGRVLDRGDRRGS